MRSSFFLASFFLALATRFSLSAAKPTLIKLPFTSPSMSGVLTSSKARFGLSFLILDLAVVLGW